MFFKTCNYDNQNAKIRRELYRSSVISVLDNVSHSRQSGCWLQFYRRGGVLVSSHVFFLLNWGCYWAFVVLAWAGIELSGGQRLGSPVPCWTHPIHANTFGGSDFAVLFCSNFRRRLMRLNVSIRDRMGLMSASLERMELACSSQLDVNSSLYVQIKNEFYLCQGP